MTGVDIQALVLQRLLQLLPCMRPTLQDPSFDVSSVAETPAPTPAPAAPASSEPARPELSKPTPTTSAAARPSRSTLYCLAGEVALIAAAVLSLQPLSPRLAMTGLTLTCQMSLLTNGIKVSLVV